MNYRPRKPAIETRRNMDGVLNAPVRRSPVSDSVADGRGRSIRQGLLRNQAARKIGDFKQPEGYHQMAAKRLQQAAVDKKSAPNASLLNMTLPGGTAHDDKKKRIKSKRDIKKLVKRSLIGFGALAGIVLIVGGFLGVKTYMKAHKVFKGGGSAVSLQQNVAPSLLKGEGDGRINILLLGKGGEGHDGADLTDTILLMSVDPVNKKASLISVPRDLWVKVPGDGYAKINSVYATAKSRALYGNPKDKKAAENAGIKASRQVVGDVLGVNIHYYSMVDFQAFKQAVDAVGGVDINVPEDLVDPTMAWENKWSSVLAKKGRQHMDGYKALLYVRSRHGSARGDFDRAERQRLLLSALAQKILNAGTYTNPVKVSQLLDAFGDHVSTDMSIGDAIRLVKIMKGMPAGGIESIGLSDPPNNFLKTGMVGSASVVVPVAGIDQYDAIREFLKTKLVDGYISKEAAKIAVLNGAGIEGLATEKADILKSYGYNVITVASAPTAEYQKTVIVDLTKGKKPYTKNYLEKRFGVKATTKLPDSAIKPGEANFVIIVGSNETTSRQN
jgi:polyisoprenyl-teichoic acid--peptidoglycan teichoic acid transferase